MDLGVQVLKYNIFLSNQTIQRTTPLIISTKEMFLNGIIASINHKSSKEDLENINLLCVAINCQMQLI
jgi:hypothetical protein